jgi:glutathione S-transferase
MALYENDTPFKPHIVDFSNETSRAEFQKIWPIGKIPVLRDDGEIHWYEAHGLGRRELKVKRLLPGEP